MPALNISPQLLTDSCLLIFDPHQDIEWCKAIIARERGRFSHLLLGGDYFDTFDAKLPSVEVMCDFLLELSHEFGDNLTVLLGNHDICYLEAERTLRETGMIAEPKHWCSGYSTEKARAIAARLDQNFWNHCRLYQFVNGWLTSHAGVAAEHWPSAKTPASAIRKFESRCARSVRDAHLKKQALLGAGWSRFGDFPVGGVTWLDFNSEFHDDLKIPYRQVFGHTTSKTGARQKGRAYCLDGFQTVYGILHGDGELEVMDRP